MRLEVKVNVFCVLMILLSIFATAYFVLFNKKIGGNILNEASEIVNGQYYLVDNDGKKNLVSQADWEKCKNVNIAFFSIAILGSLSLFYLFLRYAFLPSFIKNMPAPPPVSIRTSDRSHAGGGHWTERAQRAREEAGVTTEWRIARFLPQAKMAPAKFSIC